MLTAPLKHAKLVYNLRFFVYTAIVEMPVRLQNRTCSDYRKGAVMRKPASCVLSIALSLVMTVGFIPSPALAEIASAPEPAAQSAGKPNESPAETTSGQARANDQISAASGTNVTANATQPIDASMFSIEDTDIRYTGNPVMPTVTSSTVPSDQYTVAYENNVAIGQATAVVTADDQNYSGTCAIPFEIKPANAAANYQHSTTAQSGDITLTVQWNDPRLGQETTFHVTATGGSGAYQFRMDAPTYMDPDGSSESVADPSRNQWQQYTGECTSHDYQFEMTASGTYYLRFYLMDKAAGVYYLRSNVFASANDDAYPAVSAIVKSAVDKCSADTDGSDYARALWLHDWTLDQLEYDHGLNWCSAESGLTRHQGTCESYQRIYSKLLDAAGIANGRITGNGHTWNAVKIDGKWCQMDLTWDDTSDNWYGDLDQRHLYFGLTDELMAITHSDHTANHQKDDYAYRSTDLSNNYFVRNGKADEWAEKYADRIQQHLDAKEESFSIDADNQSLPPSISGIQNGIVAYAMNQREWKTDGYKANLTATSKVEMTSSKSWTAKYMFKAKHAESVEPSQTNYSNTPEGYARMLYAECFNTPEPTTHQISYWTGVLKQEDGPQRAVKEFFTSSVIKQKNAVEITRLLYRVVAGINNPTEAQLAYWTQHIKANGVNGAIAEFSNSKFFISQCMNYGLCNKNSQGSQSPSAYAWLLYEKCLDTPAPGQWRIDYWANVLANNGGSEKAIKEFFTSSTFRAKKPEAQARLLYNIVAGVSNPTEFQIAYWTNVINSNGLICAIENFLNSDLFTKQKLAYNIL